MYSELLLLLLNKLLSSCAACMTFINYALVMFYADIVVGYLCLLCLFYVPLPLRAQNKADALVQDVLCEMINAHKILDTQLDGMKQLGKWVFKRPDRCKLSITYDPTITVKYHSSLVISYWDVGLGERDQCLCLRGHPTLTL
jgi:hypothetical protein